MEALTEVCEAGKVRAIGFSEWTIEQIEAGLEVPGARKWVSSQPQYNLLWRAPEAELVPFCAEHGISQIVWSPLAQGVLTGKYKPGEPHPPDSRAASDQMSYAIGAYMSDEILTAVQRLVPIAEGAGLTMAQMGLAWVLREENVASAITGASRPEQVHANASASGIELSADVLEAIDEAVADVVVEGPKLGRLHPRGREAPARRPRRTQGREAAVTAAGATKTCERHRCDEPPDRTGDLAACKRRSPN